MKKFTLSMLMLLAAVMGTQAKSWKIGPSSVAGMDFASINAAMEADEVTAGDTLYLDQYYNESAEQTVNKTVVIIGTGYDTSQNDEGVVARLTNAIMLKTNNVIVRSVRIQGSVTFYANDCIIDRSYVSGLIKTNSTTAGMNCLYSCYINDGRIEGYSNESYSKMDIQNCVIIDNSCSDPVVHNIAYLTASVINNNVIYKSYRGSDYYWGYPTNNYCYCLSNIINSQITNNLVYGYNSNSTDVNNRDFTEAVVGSGSGNIIEHNIFSGTASITYYPTNETGQRNNWNNFFIGIGNYSDYYRLATESGDNPAIGYATDGGDCGCHGGMFGCPSGGRPQYIPYFKKVQVGSRTEDGKLPVTLKIAIQSE